jgi:hypothetical protein
MTTPAKVNFKLYQGSTFSEVLRWESGTKVYVPITQITKTAPMVVTAASHGVPTGWRTKITGATGMKEANTTDYVTCTDTTANTLTFNSINALNYNTYVSGGVLEYNQPVDLTGFSARMQIRVKLDDAVPVAELTTTNGGILIDNTLKTISLYISATNTALFSFNTALYSLELVSSGGTVTPFINGTVSLIREVTR